MADSSPILSRIRRRIHLFLHPRHKIAFITSIAKHGRLLDLGCGNNSPAVTKHVRSDLHYTGVDVCDYKQAKPPTDYADVYRIVSAEEFASTIESLGHDYDAVICSHNLEHCLEQDRVLMAMMNALRKNGIIYLAFPCAESVSFPSRKGTLNFYDDETHTTPPDFPLIIEKLKNAGFKILFSRRRYRPWRRFLIGLAWEPSSAKRRQVLRGTWELYGFESLIWAQKQ